MSDLVTKVRDLMQECDDLHDRNDFLEVENETLRSLKAENEELKERKRKKEANGEILKAAKTHMNENIKLKKENEELKKENADYKADNKMFNAEIGELNRISNEGFVLCGHCLELFSCNACQKRKEWKSAKVIEGFVIT